MGWTHHHGSWPPPDGIMRRGNIKRQCSPPDWANYGCISAKHPVSGGIPLSYTTQSSACWRLRAPRGQSVAYALLKYGMTCPRSRATGVCIIRMSRSGCRHVVFNPNRYPRRLQPPYPALSFSSHPPHLQAYPAKDEGHQHALRLCPRGVSLHLR